MKTQINGKDAPWTPEIWALWHTFIDDADPQYLAVPIWQANYYTPRAYQDEYDRGSLAHGFTYTMGRAVCYYTLPSTFAVAVSR